MKRKLNVLLALMLALVLVLVACGDSTPDKPATDQPVDEPTTGEETEEPTDEPTDEPAAEGWQIPTGLTGEISVQTEEGWKDYYQKAVDKIIAVNPDAKIELKELGSFDHLDVIGSTDASNADVADVFAVPADRYNDLVDNVVLGLLPADEMAAELGGFGNYDDTLGGILKSDEGYFAFPMNIETLVTFVNTKNAEVAGVDATMPIELVGQENEATVLLPIFDAWFGVAPNNAGGIDFLAENDGEFSSTYTGNYEELNADQKAAFDGMYEYWKQHNEAGTSLFDAEAGWGYIDDQFREGGNGIIRLEGPWATAAGVIAEEIEKGNIEVYPVSHITVAGKPLAHWQAGWGLGINARIEEDEDKVALAKALIMELVNPENAVDFYKSTGKILQNVEPAVYEDSDLSDIDKSVIANIFESYDVSPPRPIFKEYGQVWETWKNAVLSWNSVNPADPAAAYEQLQASFTDMMTQVDAMQQ